MGAVGPQRCWWEHPQPQVQVIAGMWWGSLAGRARRTWGNLRVQFGCSQGISWGIRAHLTAQQPCKACQVLGLQKLFWIGVMWRRVTPCLASFLSFREAIYFLRVPGILQSLQDSPQTLICPAFYMMWKKLGSPVTCVTDIYLKIRPLWGMKRQQKYVLQYSVVTDYMSLKMDFSIHTLIYFFLWW